MLTRSAIKLKSYALLKALESSNGPRQNIILKDLNELLFNYPQSSEICKSKINLFLSIAQSKDESLSAKSRKALALIGYTKPPRSAGIRILSIDGGGTRGLVSMEIIRHIETITKKRIHELFDIICGVSSGAIIAMAVGSCRYTLDECEAFYRKMSEDVFKTDWIWTSTPRLIMNHAYYDSLVFENVLKKAFGNADLVSLTSRSNLPKLVAIAVNAHTVQPFLFRTYTLDRMKSFNFEGTCRAEIWQALRASSAAPGFFQEFKFGSQVLLDGAMLVNNCTGIALAEAKSIWPDEPIQCVVSIGSGIFKQNDILKSSATSLYEKAHSLVYSATDTETVHLTLQHLIPNYYRFNPQLSENMIISENRKLKLDQLRKEALSYMTDHEQMLNELSNKLTKRRPIRSRISDCFKY